MSLRMWNKMCISSWNSPGQAWSKEETVITEHQQTPNEIAYRNLKPTIDRTYPKGQLIAIHNQQIVANAATFPELLANLAAQGLNSKECLAVQAGVDYLDFAYI